MPRTKGATKESVKINTIKLFQKRVIEKKPLQQIAEELGTTTKTLHEWKKRDDYRKMAIEHLENSTLKGLQGTVGKLVKALDAKRPVVTEAADGSTNIRHVPDNKTRMTALQEIIQIYGLHAPQKRDVNVGVSVTSDKELFDQIEQAERKSRCIDSYEVREGRHELAEAEQRHGDSVVAARRRTLLQDGPVPESE